jgi:3-hydroxyisobutyrate dehydrogenase-like beta-hydroxyacid dehydrogenase
MERIAIIGHGEAARTFIAAGLPVAAAYDIDAARRTGRAAFDDAGAVLAGATLVLSLVTAGAALDATRTCAPLLGKGAYWCDMNSVGPQTKRAAARLVAEAGAIYVDAALLAPVEPARLGVPLLVAGPAAAVARLRAAGFTDVVHAGAEIGRAAAVKLIRSVMVKGIEALTDEMMAAARAAGVVEPVLASLGANWRPKVDYNLERMAVHGVRRAAEMAEAVATLEALGVDPVMTRGTVLRQRRAGAATTGAAPAGTRAAA